MTQLVYTAVGYGVGYYFGGPTGGRIGAALGAYLGGLQAAPDQFGPRLDDTQVQAAAYGASIPRIWGSDKTTGAVIWAAPMVEHVTEESGKGGLGPEITTYSYTRSFAVLIGEGPITGVRRVWADAELIYDKADIPPEVSTLPVRPSQVSRTDYISQFLRFYTGTESQLPDPTIEAIEGVGNVEAYRGLAYMVATDFPIDFFRRIPIFRFEVTTAAAGTLTETVLEPLVVYDWEKDPTDPNGDGRPMHPQLDAAGNYTDRCDFQAVERVGLGVGTDFDAKAQQQAADFAADTLQYQASSAAGAVKYAGLFYTSVNTKFSTAPGGATIEADVQAVYAKVCQYRAQIAPMADTSLAYNIEKPRETHIPLQPKLANLWAYAVMLWGKQHSGGAVPPSGYGNSPYTSLPIGGGQLVTFWATYMLTVQCVRQPTHDLKSAYPGSPIGKVARYWSAKRSGWKAELPSQPQYAVDRYGNVTPNYTWVITTGTAKQLCAVEYRNGLLYQQALGPVLLPGDANYSNTAYWNARQAEAVAAGLMAADVSYPVVVSSYATGTRPPATYFPKATVTLAAVVADICGEAGLSGAQFDVSALAGDVVYGYTRGRRMPARSLIEPLRSAYFFDVVESGDKLKFVKRGGSPVATITAEDLGAALDVPRLSAVESTRQQEAELPISVQVLYRSEEAIYENGTQESRRRVGGTTQQAGVELAMVLPDAQAAQIADVLLYDVWVQRVARKLCTWRKWAELEPTDVVTVVDGSFTHRLRIVDKSEQQGVIELEARDDSAEVLVSSAAASVVAGAGVPLTNLSPTVAELLDVPLLREEDAYTPGYYIAGRPVGGKWTAGKLYQQKPGATAYDMVAFVRRPSVMGQALTKLGDWTGGNMPDEGNTVTVLVGGGSLSSVPLEDLLSYSNAAVLGDEVIQFRTATLVAANTYRLSGLLRGRLGTERHQAAHVVGERFVMLSTENLVSQPLQAAWVGQSLSYKALSYGENPANVGAFDFTCNAVRLKPLAPVHLRVGTLGGAAGYAASWVRRARAGTGWRNGVEVSLYERTERYRVRVMFGALEVEVQYVTSPSATVGVGRDLTYHTLEVCQMSDAVGPGFPATVNF